MKFTKMSLVLLTTLVVCCVAVDVPCSTNSNCMGQCCPIGQHTFRDGNACTGGGLPDCSLCGNSDLAQCQNQNPTMIEIKEATSDGTAQGGYSGRYWRFTVMHENMPAWGDLVQSTFFNIPGFMKGIPAMIPNHETHDNYIAEFICPPYNPTPCDAYVIQYRCSTCPFHNGNLPSIVIGSGFEASSCAPWFKVTPARPSHSMISFRKQLAPGERVSFMVKKGTQFAGLAFNPMGVDCSKFTSAYTCMGQEVEGLCKWNPKEEACENNYCPRPPQPYGPNAPCKHCALHDLY